MKNLPASLKYEINKLTSANPWIALLDIKISDSLTLYLCNNPDEITFNGHTYTPINFEIEATKNVTNGEIPTVTLRVSNVTRVLQGYLEELKGGVGLEVKVNIVDAAYLDEDYSELELVFEIIATTSDAHWVTFTLGSPNPLRKRFPADTYLAGYCRWKFKSAECGYSGSETSCDHTLENCKRLGNQARFGGFDGLSGGYFRLV